MRSLVILLLPLLLLTGCEKFALVRQMDELCKKDAGITIYEEVKFPRSRFDEFGKLKPLIPYGNGRRISNSERYFLNEYEENRKNNTVVDGKSNGSLEGRSLYRSEYSIIRVADGKLLGKEISYHVTAGNIWYEHWGGASCPSGKVGLTSLIFKMEH